MSRGISISTTHAAACSMQKWNTIILLKQWLNRGSAHQCSCHTKTIVINEKCICINTELILFVVHVRRNNTVWRPNGNPNTNKIWKEKSFDVIASGQPWNKPFFFIHVRSKAILSMHTYALGRFWTPANGGVCMWLRERLYSPYYAR